MTALCRYTLTAAIVFGLSACGHGASAPEKPRVVYSPNGEPLSGGPLGLPDCDDAVSGWFDRADTNRDGTIDLNEFLADARRQFAVMDLDHDGNITPGELAIYRTPYGQSSSMAPLPEDVASDVQSDDSSDGDNPSKKPSSPILLDQADPVMSADVNLHYKVTLPEFLALAKRKFSQLDTSHSGHPDKASIVRLWCRALSPR